MQYRTFSKYGFLINAIRQARETPNDTAFHAMEHTIDLGSATTRVDGDITVEAISAGYRFKVILNDADPLFSAVGTWEQGLSWLQDLADEHRKKEGLR